MFYSLLPTVGHNNLTESGLADHTGYLNVNPQTLQHKKYDNVFGVGDVLNVPTTKTFYAGVSQVAVVRNNIERKINGLSLNAKYDGFSEAPLFLSNNKVTWASHLYNGVTSSLDTSSFMGSVRNFTYTKFGKSDISNILKKSTWGPPYYKTKKTFTDAGSPAVKVAT